MAHYTQNQIDKALENLPEELQETLFSTETTDAIANACARHNISDPNQLKITEYAGYVLMGLMLPSEFAQALQKELKIPKKTADAIAHEVNRFIFYPVKPVLEQIHSTEVGATRAATPPRAQQATQEEQEEQPRAQERKGPDAYQEPIE